MIVRQCSYMENHSYIERQHLIEMLLEHHPQFIDEVTPDEATVLRTYYALGLGEEDLRAYGRRFEAEHRADVAAAATAFDKIITAAGVEPDWEIKGLSETS